MALVSLRLRTPTTARPGRPTLRLAPGVAIGVPQIGPCRSSDLSNTPRAGMAHNWLETTSSAVGEVPAAQLKENVMSVAKVSEITAESAEGFDAAIREGIGRATKTLKNVKSVWIKDQEIEVKDDRPRNYRVTMKVTFVLND
jgi:dodecin